ncbi:MAG TPA: hypothetical protein VF590_23615 [Isosphaeraceae bacterium]
MKRFALIFLVLLGATRLAPHPACASEPEPRAAEVPRLSRTGPESGPAPSWYRAARPAKTLKGDLAGVQALTGGLALSRERALHDAHQQLEQVVRDWLALDGVPPDWTVPGPLLERLIRAEHVEPVLRDDLGPELDDYKVLYQAAYRVDFAPQRKAAILAAYEQDLVRTRLGWLVGFALFVLACLAALAGYIRADEATQGYYTNRLRLAAAAGVGAAGVAVYHLLT